MSFDGFQPSKGNRDTLTRDQLFMLDDQVLPTARKWVRDFPGLADHGRQTLAYWGEVAPEAPRP